MSQEIAVSEPSVLAIISAAAADPSVDVAKMNALLEFKERLDARDARAQYTAAMAAMQPSLPRVRKNGTIDLGKGKGIPFASWEDIDGVIRPMLSRHGFSLSFPTRIEGEKTIMTCIVSHAGGHSERSDSYVLPDKGPGRNDTQAVGSGRKYTKRYLALDMLNIVTEGVDDDGAATSYLTPDQVNRVLDMVTACDLTGDSMKRFLTFAAADTIEHIQRADFNRVMEALNSALRKRS